MKGFLIAVFEELYLKKKYLLEGTEEMLTFMNPLQNTIAV